MRKWNETPGLALLTGLLLGMTNAEGTTDQDPQPLRTFGLGDLQTIAVAPDGRHFATAGQSGAFLWDLEHGAVKHRIDAHGWRVSALAFSPNGQVLLTAGNDRLIRAWDVGSGAELRSFAGHLGEITSLAFGTDTNSFVSTSADNTARVWSLETGEPGPMVRVPGVFVRAAMLAPDGQQLVTADGSQTNNVRLWDLATQTTIRTFGEHVGQVSALGFVAGDHLATAGDDGVVRIWNLETGTRLRSLEGASPNIMGLAFPQDGRKILAGCHDGRIVVWDLETGEREHDSQGLHLFALGMIPGLNRILAASSDNLIRDLDWVTGEAVRTLEGHTTSATLGVAFSPDGHTVLSGGAEASIRLWDRATSRQIRTLTGHGGGTSTVAFSPDGRRILSTRGFPKPCVQLWNAETGQVEREYSWNTGWPTCASFSRDGSRIAAGAQNERVLVWDVETGALVRTLTGRPAIVTAVAFSPDGTKLASGGSSFAPVVNLWDLGTGQTLHTFELEAGSVTALDFSSTGEELLVGWEDGYLRVFEVASGRMKREYNLATAYLNAAVFSPDDSMILTGEGWPSFVARLVDVQSARTLRVFTGHRWSVDAVAFDASGTRILTGSDSVRLWSADDAATRLRIERNPGGIELRWNLGTLQQAPAVDGPWEDVVDATSPWILPADGPTAFHRIRVEVRE